MKRRATAKTFPQGSWGSNRKVVILLQQQTPSTPTSVPIFGRNGTPASKRHVRLVPSETVLRQSHKIQFAFSEVLYYQLI